MSAIATSAFPMGLPARIDDGSAWYGPDMAARTDWIEVLSGLEPSEKVVLNPQGLRTGQPVVVKGQKEDLTQKAEARGAGQ